MATRIVRPITNWNAVPIMVDIAMVATIIGKSYESTRRLAASGSIPAVKIGSEWRVSKETLMKLVGASN